ncbi:MAG: hypothetical protein U1E56_12715 [Bauldia sp.]
MTKTLALALAGAVSIGAMASPTAAEAATIKHPKTAIIAGTIFGFALGTLAAHSYPYYYYPTYSQNYYYNPYYYPYAYPYSYQIYPPYVYRR